MLRSMYSGVSGMKNFQTKLDVIGNNIANVNTVGFKKGRVTFQDMMSQTTSGAQGPTANRGGMNAAQVGLGSQLGSIDNLHTQGFRQTTNIVLDIALEGDGMFAVATNTGRPTAAIETARGALKTAQDALATALNTTPVVEATVKTAREDVKTKQDELNKALNWDVEVGVASLSYTRAGNFYLDTDGAITNADGMYLVGFEYTPEEPAKVGPPPVAAVPASLDTTKHSVITIPEDAESFSIQTDGVVNYIDSNGNPQVAGKISIANFSNPAGLQKSGSNLFLNTPNAGFTGFVEGETNGSASLISGSLEMSNVDLAEEFTEMITAQRGFQANTRIISTSDEILQELVNLKR